MRRISPRVVLSLLLGLFIGIFITQPILWSISYTCQHSYLIHPEIQGDMQKGLRHGTEIPPKSNIYLGMMSAAKFVPTRVQRNVDTWLQKGGWKVEVFADTYPDMLKVPPGLDISIVTLPTVEDTAYPPQKKSFLMLRHMHDHHINDYEWFIRADDDSYTDFPRLQRLLNKINSSLPVFLGSPGFGMDADDGIEEGMKYLMGGLGMIFSRELLKQLRPHLKHCIQHLYSPHEDIEIGRCVWKHTKAITPTAWETVDLFYQQYEKDTGAVVDIVMEQLTPKRTSKTVTYHAVKAAELMHRLHKQVLSRHVHALLNRTARIRNEIAHMNQVLVLHANSLSLQSGTDSLIPLMLGGSDSKVSWKREGNPWPDEAHWYPNNASVNKMSSKLPWIHWDKYYRHDVRDPIVPMRGHSKVEKEAIANMLSDIEGHLIKDACPKFPPNVQFNYGYMQYGSLEGVRVITVHRSSAGSTIKFCRTTSQITYGDTLFWEGEIPLSKNEILQSSMKSNVGILGRAVGDLLGVRDYNDELIVGLQEPPLSVSDSALLSANHRIIFIIPLQGRYRALEQFMESYEKNFLKPAQDMNSGSSSLSGNVQLAIVLLGNDEQGDDLGLNRAAAHLLRSYQTTYGPHLVRYHMASTGDRSFSRGAGIQLGSLIGEENDILFFMDIDMIVTPNVVAQCRRNVGKGKVAWYPVPYSQYDPDRLCYKEEIARDLDIRSDLVYAGGVGPVPKEDVSMERQRVRASIKRTPLTLNRERGFWRDFGFGIACMYKSDFIRTGGFDLTIEGWGEEDIRLFVSLIKSGMDVFRAKQADLVHIFHPKHCDMVMEEEQRKACMRTKASHYASQQCLANTWFKKFLKPVV